MLDFRVSTRCVGFSRCYLLGQIFVFLHAVLAIAGFSLLGQIFVFVHTVLPIAGFSLLGQIFVFVHAVLAIAGVICWGRFSCLFTLCWL